VRLSLGCESLGLRPVSPPSTVSAPVAAAPHYGLGAPFPCAGGEAPPVAGAPAGLADFPASATSHHAHQGHLRSTTRIPPTGHQQSTKYKTRSRSPVWTAGAGCPKPFYLDVLLRTSGAHDMSAQISIVIRKLSLNAPSFAGPIHPRKGEMEPPISVSRAGDPSHIFHIIPRNHALQLIVGCHHNVPVQTWTTTRWLRME